MVGHKNEESFCHLAIDSYLTLKDTLGTSVFIRLREMLKAGFPGGADSKESACNVADPGSVPGLGRSSGEGNGNPLQYSSPENPHGQRCLEGYSPWGHKESDMTEQLSTYNFSRSHIYALIYTICFSELLHSVWQSLGPSMSLLMTQFHSFLRTTLF